MPSPPPPPALPDELAEEILLRLPPDDPASLLRSSLVCKAWACAVSRRGFRRRLQELHRTPPVHGVLHNWNYWEDGRIPRFIRTTPSSFSLAAPDRRSWQAIDCRHGRALFLSKAQDNLEMLLWEPITGTQQRVPVPAAFKSDHFPTAAVFCAADGCDHRDCLGGPFRVVFVFSIVEDIEDEEFVMSACVYSSETGAWGEPTSMHGEFAMDLMSMTNYCSSVLVGRSLIYFISENGQILEYDLARHGLNEIDSPDKKCMSDKFNLMLTDGGGLGVSEGLGLHLKLWTREVTDYTDARWVLSRVIYLQNLLPYGDLMNAKRSVQVLAFAEEANVIFVSTAVAIFTIELQSEHVRKVCDDQGFDNLIPVVSFYTPVPPGEHQNLLASLPNEKAGGEAGAEGEKEKTVYQAHMHPFDKGSNAIKEGDFVSHDLKIRVPCHGEGATALNKHGCALVPKVSSDDVPKSSRNEELVKGTTSIDDDGNSTTFDSNVDGATPSEKDLKERILKQQQEEEDRKHEHKEKK